MRARLQTTVKAKALPAHCDIHCTIVGGGYQGQYVRRRSVA